MLKSKPSKGKEPIALEEEEWCFNCPDDEWDACMHYEYAREFVKAHPAIAQAIESTPVEQRRHELMFDALAWRNDPDQVPLFIDGFPRTRWMELGPDDRKKAIEGCKHHVGRQRAYPTLVVNDDFDFAPLQAHVNRLRCERKLWGTMTSSFLTSRIAVKDSCTDPLAAGLAVDPGPYPEGGHPDHLLRLDNRFTVAVIELDAMQSKKELRIAFERLLEAVLGDTKPSKKVSRGSSKDQLQQLGALRLVQHYKTAEKAFPKLKEASKGCVDMKLNYGSARAMRRAAEDARCHLRMMEEWGRFGHLGGRPKCPFQG